VFENNVIATTGQSWKIGAGLVVTLGSVAAMYWGLNNLETPGTNLPILFAAISPFAALGAFALLAAAVRCPECGARWIWRAVSRQSSDKWLPWLALAGG